MGWNLQRTAGQCESEAIPEGFLAAIAVIVGLKSRSLGRVEEDVSVAVEEKESLRERGERKD